MTMTDSARTLACPDRPLPGRPDDRARRDDRECRAAVDPRRPRVLADLPGVGRERLSPHLRRLPAPRRPARRPVRAAPDVPRRDLALHGRLARVRSRDLAGLPRRGTRGTRRRRRGRLRGGALPDHVALHRARRARQGDGRLRLRPLGRRRRGRASRRRPHRPARLALDLPRQHPGRDRRRRALAPAPARRSRCGRHDGGSTSRGP